MAAVLVDTVYREYAESLVLARVFMTVPYAMLPERQRAFADALARGANLSSELRPDTPVQSLLASRGCLEEWNDAGRSRGHVALPLLSEPFVETIPMMARLLRDLGLPLTWVQTPAGTVSGQTIGSEVGFFHVDDASSATDERGRLVIPAREFVAAHGVRSVFAVGGVVFGGAALVMVLFCRERVEKRSVRLFMPLINFLKSTLILRGCMCRIFVEAGGAPERAAEPLPGAER